MYPEISPARMAPLVWGRPGPLAAGPTAASWAVNYYV